MEKILFKDLSYKLVGLFYKVQLSLGRFCRERQYGDALENLLRNASIDFKREFPISLEGRNSNFADFLIEDQILVELKTKPFIAKEDYFQMKRYLESASLELGLLVNFRQRYLAPKRVLNSRVLEHSDKFVV